MASFYVLPSMSADISSLETCQRAPTRRGSGHSSATIPPVIDTDNDQWIKPANKVGSIKTPEAEKFHGNPGI